MMTFSIIYGIASLIASLVAFFCLLKLDRASWLYDEFSSSRDMSFGIGLCSLAALIVGVLWPIAVILFLSGLVMSVLEKKNLRVTPTLLLSY